MREDILAALVMLGGVSAARPTPRPATLPVYDLRIAIRPDSLVLRGSGTITIPAAPQTRDSVAVSLSERMDSVRIEVVPSGEARVERVLRPHAQPGWGTVSWIVRPARPFPAREAVTLRFSYVAHGDGASFVYAVGRECAFGAGILTAWYPELDDGPLPRSGGVRGLRGTGAVTFDLPAGWVARSPGIQRSTQAEEARGTFRFRVDSPSFLSFAAARYIVSTEEGAFPVSVYQLHPRPNVASYARSLARVFAVLRREFGPVAHRSFAVAEVPIDQARRAGFDGASLDGFMVVQSQYLDRDFSTAYFGHEMSHQWWGNRVRTTDTSAVSTLFSEGLAQYGSLRAVEEIEGEAAAERYRRTGYPGFFDYGAELYLRGAAAGFDWPLRHLPADPGLNRTVILSKGMLVWDMLSREVGRDRFRAALAAVSQRYADRRVPFGEFLAAIAQQSGTDVSWFVEQWMERAGAPEWRLTWRQVGSAVEGEITQSAPFYRATLELIATDTSGRRARRTVVASGPRTTFTWSVATPVREVALDPRSLVLRWTPELRAKAEQLAAYTRGEKFIDQGRGEEAVREFQAGLARLPRPDAYGAEFLLHSGLAEVLSFQKRSADARAQLDSALASPSRPGAQLPWIYLQLATIASDQGDTAAVTRAIDAIQTADAIAGVKSGALEQARALRPTGPPTPP